MGLFVIKCVSAPYAVSVIIFGIAGYITAFPKRYAKQRRICIVSYYKQGKNHINGCTFNNFHFQSVS